MCIRDRRLRRRDDREYLEDHSSEGSGCSGGEGDGQSGAEGGAGSVGGARRRRRGRAPESEGEDEVSSDAKLWKGAHADGWRVHAKNMSHYVYVAPTGEQLDCMLIAFDCMLIALCLRRTGRRALPQQGGGLSGGWAGSPCDQAA